MATLTVPTPPEGRFRWLTRIDFDGVFFKVLFRYNRRDAFWYIDFADDQGVAIVRALRLALSDDILKPYKTALDLPKGNLFVTDTSGRGRESGRDDLGGRVLLRYTEVDSGTATV